MSSRTTTFLGLSILAALAFAPAATARGTVLLTRDEAFELAFPKAKVERTTAFLSKEEQKKVSKLSGVDFDRGCIYPYVAKKDGKVVGTAYLDNHRVRTQRETVMIVVTPDSKVARIEVLAFGEPTDYIPRDIWYGQFTGKPLSEELNLKRAIRGVAGATLTARATTDSARRVLAVHQVLAERSAPPERIAKGEKPR